MKMTTLNYSIASIAFGMLWTSCSYFDSDGLSVSSGTLSVEDIQGCYYDIAKSYSDGNRYWECTAICVGTDSATVSEKKMYMNEDYTEIDSSKAPIYKENKYDVELSGIGENGVFPNNVRIGKEYYRYFINESPKYLRIYKKYNGETEYFASEENVCEQY